jgi:hypothetical protein
MRRRRPLAVARIMRRPVALAPRNYAFAPLSVKFNFARYLRPNFCCKYHFFRLVCNHNLRALGKFALHQHIAHANSKLQCTRDLHARRISIFPQRNLHRKQGEDFNTVAEGASSPLSRSRPLEVRREQIDLARRIIFPAPLACARETVCRQRTFSHPCRALNEIEAHRYHRSDREGCLPGRVCVRRGI